MKISVMITAVFCIFAFTNCANGNQRAENSEELVERIVNSDVPVLVDFWAAWCMPCRILDPIIEDLEKVYEGSVRFVKVDVDKHPGISSYFRVSAVPSVYLIEDKTVRTMVPGLAPRQMYVDAIESVLKMAEERSRSAPAAKQPPSEAPCVNC